MGAPLRPSARSWLAAVTAAAITFLAVRSLLPAHAPTASLPNAAQADHQSSTRAEPEALTRLPLAKPLAPAPEDPAIRSPAPSKSEGAAQSTASPTTTAPAPPLGPKALVYGTVKDEEGQALVNVLLHTRAPGGDLVHTKTDPDGRYALGPLPEGSWSITTYTEARHCPEFKVQVDGDTTLVRRDIVLPRQQVVRIVIVTSNGAPAVPLLRSKGLLNGREALTPVATREQPGDMIGLDRTTLWEAFGVGAPMPRYTGPEPRGEADFVPLAIHVRGTTWVSLVSHHCVLDSRRVTEDVEEVRFVLDPEDLLALRGNVQATLLDAESGAPVTGKVSIGTRPWFDDASAVTSESGTGAVILGSLSPGRQWWMARAEGYADAKQEIVVPRGGHLDLGPVQLQRPVSLRGLVVDAEGLPVEAILALGTVDPATGSVTPVEGGRYQSSPDGRFAMEGLVPARYALQVKGVPATPPVPFDPRLRSLPLTIDARSGAPPDVQLVALQTTRVTLPTGKFEEPWPYLKVLTAEGLTADATWLGRWLDNAWIDVLPGEYSLRVQRQDGSHFERPLTVGTKPFQIELTEGLDDEP